MHHVCYRLSLNPCSYLDFPISSGKLDVHQLFRCQELFQISEVKLRNMLGRSFSRTRGVGGLGKSKTSAVLEEFKSQQQIQHIESDQQLLKRVRLLILKCFHLKYILTGGVFFLVKDSGNGFIWSDEEMAEQWHPGSRRRGFAEKLRRVKFGHLIFELRSFPAIAQMPLGSANDFGNILGWGQLRSQFF